MGGSVQEFESHRRWLLAMAYRWVRSTAEAEDIVSEAWIRWHRVSDIRDHSAVLATIVSRLCSDHLKSARVRREKCDGAVLPEPSTAAAPPTPDGVVERNEEVMLVAGRLLERLNPAERGVLVLRHGFEYSYRDVSQVLGIREASCRQLYSRGRARLVASARRFATEPAKQAELASRLAAASRAGDLAALERLLAADVKI
ncbi:sigma-70 family RNA polymerase sigma factor [Salinispora arenicola]|uniref:RNA polymerase, sigma-24 subunit, ECF subfamily n=1 Tax=Salinispora arenicola (strain CNS-205) TaxID=391037 RepID=A8M126_SALAI|nr:sigma-70 family RNA polymerase sigma factor [Salinispora arenicola]MCN0177295.1 sigma-70 family RNA polymerase sigma factor [Salinispora arenicola]NIL55886.1 sigma-70 family RNA polymerase sigma factor [Salinispora arenicola]NIL60572.1 sigma-70 family RNA polymerase sigma factor [Salinispora arenicola]